MSISEGLTAAGESSDPVRSGSEESLLASLLDELMEAQRQGRRPDVEQAAARYPALATDLRSLWATVWVAEEMARNGPSDPDPLAGPATVAGTIDARSWTQRGAVVSPGSGPEASDSNQDLFGDYELFEELGRGGMGVVWRA